MMTAMTPSSWYAGIRIPLALLRSDDDDTWGERAHNALPAEKGAAASSATSEAAGPSTQMEDDSHEEECHLHAPGLRRCACGLCGTPAEE